MTALRKTFGQFVKTFANVFDASFILILYIGKKQNSSLTLGYLRPRLVIL